MSKQLPYLKHWFWLIQPYTIDFTFTFFISLVLDSKLCHEMAAVRLASGLIGGAFMQFCGQVPWGQKDLHH